MIAVLALVADVIWLVMLVARGGFWREGVLPPAPRPQSWPDVVAVVPARDEAEGIADAVESLLTQDYPGRFRVIVVDDHSSDGTADIARAAAERLGAADRLTVLPGAPLPAGWTGKLWAVSQGIAAAEAWAPDYLLLTDADIRHHPTNLAELAARAAAETRDLVSLMVRLRCDSPAERALVPAFVLFFAMLYPFAWVRDPRRRTAAAAGGCMLVRRQALAAAGGIAAIRARLIDDVSLGQALKARGRIWLGLSQATVSLRRYPRFADVWAMVSRCAYAQLGFSPWLLAGTILGLSVTFLAAPVAAVTGALAGDGAAATAGGLAWAMMALAFVPILRLYARPIWWAPALPAVAVIYSAATLGSAWAHHRGRGGAWKGRTHQPAA